MGRLRALLETSRRYGDPRAASCCSRAPAQAVAVLAPPIEGEQASLVALLSDGAPWSTSALALALGASQRTVQRALAELEAGGRVRALDGRGTALAGAAAGRIHDDLVTPHGAAV